MTFTLWQNIPFFCLIGCLFSAAVTSVLPHNAARRFMLGVLSLVTIASWILCLCMCRFPESYTFKMGHYSAPWGNEIRIGRLEGVIAAGFSTVMLLSMLGGCRRACMQIETQKQNLYYVMILLLTCALLAQIYSNDIFTCYVFLEIMTIAACSLITARNKGRTLVAAARYMIMNLLGSGLFLLGVILLYGLTGQLLMEDAREAVQNLFETGAYSQPLQVVVVLFTVGLGIKSALYPFHTWVGDAYSTSTPASSAMLSSLVSKGYILLLYKLYVRVLGHDVLHASGIYNVLFLFSLIGIIMGSVEAIREKHIGRMLAFSSVSQIGYIYMGIAIGTESGEVAAIYQLLAHSVAKAMLFISCDSLRRVSGDSAKFQDLRGAARRAPLAGAAFSLGAASLTGIPFTGGFVGKVLLAEESMNLSPAFRYAALAALCVSTFLNVLYMMRTVITLYRNPESEITATTPYKDGKRAFSLVLFMAFCVLLGLIGMPLTRLLASGVADFM